MISSEEIACKMVRLTSENFENEMLEGLARDRIFAITELPEELKKGINDLFKAGDHLFDNVHENPEGAFSDKNGHNETNGLHKVRKYKFGCNNGSRFFITFKNNTITNETMPQFGDDSLMADAAKEFDTHTDVIINKIATTIAKSLSISTDEMVNAHIGESYVCLTRYYPITQKRIAQMFQDKILQVDDKSILQFVPHYDATPMTLMAYRGDIRGLMGQDHDTKEYKKITVNSGGEPCLLVFTGITLKELTNGWVKPLKHQVVTTAEEQRFEAMRSSNEWRFTVSKFV
ncbi:MAG: hypothetical protein M3R00_06830, partial [Pseudomonadota bacterium]|nr:hypothetical protein [Pseudomonadota bacterium]